MRDEKKIHITRKNSSKRTKQAVKNSAHSQYIEGFIDHQKFIGFKIFPNGSVHKMFSL